MSFLYAAGILDKIDAVAPIHTELAGQLLDSQIELAVCFLFVWDFFPKVHVVMYMYSEVFSWITQVVWTTDS